MSSYFDALSREIAAAYEHEDIDQRTQAVVDVEAQLYADVTAITGDREFPDDLREKAMGILACKAAFQPSGLVMPDKVRRHIEGGVGYSRAVEDMHELFHDLARRRLSTRFCAYMGDSPTQLALLRDEHDNPEEECDGGCGDRDCDAA